MAVRARDPRFRGGRLSQRRDPNAGIDLLRKRPTMTPFAEPQRGARPLNPEADEIIRDEREEVEG